MDARVLVALIICSMMAGCLSGEDETFETEDSSSHATNFTQQTTVYVNDTLPSSTAVCVYYCVGGFVLQETDLDVTNTTVTQMNYQITWADAEPICQHLRLQVYYAQAFSWGGSAREILYSDGQSPLAGRVEDNPLPLNETLWIYVVVAIRPNPDDSPVSVWRSDQVEYSLQLDLEHRETLPGDADWLSEPQTDSPTRIVPEPSPYIPLCG